MRCRMKKCERVSHHDTILSSAHSLTKENQLQKIEPACSSSTGRRRIYFSPNTGRSYRVSGASEKYFLTLQRPKPQITCENQARGVNVIEFQLKENIS